MSGPFENRSERLTVAVSVSHLKLLQAYADAHDKSLSKAIGDLLEDALPLMQSLTKVALAAKKAREAKVAKAMRGVSASAAG